MFTNVPQDMVITIIKAIMHSKDIERKIINNTISIIKVISEQNYFKHNDNLAMGAPTSIFSEIFLQYLEHNTIYNILKEHHIMAYFRYVDDILMTFNPNNL
jgi:hypothetical protein